MKLRNMISFILKADFEIRFYHSSLKAKVVSQKNANGNFYKLFQFITETIQRVKN